jgi:GNAT superfamily N-acetyltransferase
MNGQLDALIKQHDVVEATAYRDMFAAAPPAMTQALGLQIREVAGATLMIASGIPSPVFNRVIGLGNNGVVDDTMLATIVASYRDAGVNDWWLHVSPTTHNAQLANALQAHGFVLAERRAWAKMIRDNAPPVPVATEAEIGLIAAGEENALAEAICAAFEIPQAMAPWFAALAARPQWHAVAAKRDGRIIGGGYLHLQDEHAWLGAGGVCPEARRLHVHRALMTRRIQQAIAAGCTQLFTETGEAIGDEPNPSLRNMHACGFHHAFSRLNYAAPK